MELKNSDEKFKKLNNEHQAKEDKIKQLAGELEKLKCDSGPIDMAKQLEDMKNKAGKYEEVLKERNDFKAQLCRMKGIDEVLNKLKKRADEADRMQEEIDKLTRELQRRGAAGDEAPKQRVESACKQCRRYAEDLSRVESLLEAEIQKNVATEAERNFLRQRVRGMDVLEAELILYKTKYDESECKLMMLKELMVKADMNEKLIRELKKKLAESECLLRNSDAHCDDLIVSFANSFYYDS